MKINIKIEDFVVVVFLLHPGSIDSKDCIPRS